MTVYTVSFFGHREVKGVLRIEQQLEDLIFQLLRRKEYIAFLVGRDGTFDQLVSSVIRRSKRKYRDDNCALIWVLPYPTAQLREYEDDFRDYYDEIEVCEVSTGCHYKNAHQTRNRTMVDRSDLVVFCVQHNGGGAWKTMQYARKRGKSCINLEDRC